jgi:hypothetical protein
MMRCTVVRLESRNWITGYGVGGSSTAVEFQETRKFVLTLSASSIGQRACPKRTPSLAPQHLQAIETLVVNLRCIKDAP